MKNFAFTIGYNGVSNKIQTQATITNTESTKSKNTKLAVWDSGATKSSININLAEELGLKPIGKITAGTANGPALVNQYYINLKLPNNILVPNLVVTGSNLNENTDMLIGMDIITLGQLTISTKDGRTFASFVIPALSQTDYVQELKDIEKARLKNYGRNKPCPCGSGKKVKDCCLKKFE